MASQEQILAEKQELQYTIQELALNIERQDAQIRHLTRTVAEIESRKWLPKIPLLSSSKEDHNNNDTTEISPPDTTGNYDTNSGILSKSLDLIENEIFYSENSESSGDHRIIHEALVYLKLN